MRVDCRPPQGTRGADRGNRGMLWHIQRRRTGKGDVHPVVVKTLGGGERRKTKPDCDKRSAPCACRDIQGAVDALSECKETWHDRHAMSAEPQGVHGLV